MSEITKDDLRASVAAGNLTEAQAANLLTLAQARAGLRVAEDEPFELFKGFSEIFVAVGLSILIAGIGGLTALLQSYGISLMVCVALAWWCALYFTLKRRMMLPSIILTSAYALAVLGAAFWVVDEILGAGSDEGSLALAAILIVTGLSLALWYRRFHLPFTMFLLGLVGFALALVISGNLSGNEIFRSLSNFDRLFDLRGGSSSAFGTLVFGVVALAGGLWFDMRDPHRLGRGAASGFWLHIIAAPALVNTIALTFYNMGPGAGYALLALSLAAIALLAVVIDRRSFLTAGIGYLIFLISYVITDPTEPGSWAVVLFVVGLGLTGLGTFWTDLRLRIMRALPNFPGKHRLPPYAE